MKHVLGVNLENLKFEQVNKEMEVDEAAQASVAPAEENAPKPEATLLGLVDGDNAAAA